MTVSEEFKYSFKWFKDDFDTEPSTRGRVFAHRSVMEDERCHWEPPLPSVLSQGLLVPQFSSNPSPDFDPDLLARWPEFGLGSTRDVVLVPSSETDAPANPPRVGIILTGESVPSSGTHNVILGIVRYVCENLDGEVLGFLGGPQGFARDHFIPLTPEKVRNYLNQGGADLLGFGSLRAIDESDFNEIMTLSIETYKLTSIVFIGGPNELAHVSQIVQFSQKFPNQKNPTIVGVFQSPNSNVFQSTWLPVTLGYDSTRNTLAELVGNIALDGLSSGKVNEINVIRCGSTTMTMEIGLLVGPALTILGDEIRAKNTSLDILLDSIKAVATQGLKTATVLMSDKFYQCLPGFSELQSECRAIYVSKPTLVGSLGEEFLSSLTPASKALLLKFPINQQRRIARAYDAEGNPTMPDLEPEKFLAYLLTSQDPTLVVRTHNVGPEARCPLPSDFDCSLGLALGYTAAALASSPGCHGYIAGVKNLTCASPSEWICGGFPLAQLLSVRPRDSAVLSEQYGGANQELINLAKQRVEREACVPMIALRPKHILIDPLYQVFRCDGLMRQPGPYQFGLPCNDLPIALAPRTLDSNLSRLEKIRNEQYVPSAPEWIVDDKFVTRDSPVTVHRSPLNVLQLAFPRTHSSPAVVIEQTQTANESLAASTVVGLVFLGRPSAGCHNLVYGLVRSGVSKVLGFRNGATGLISGDIRELSLENASEHLNISGINILGRTETPIRTNAELQACARSCRKLRLDCLIVVGGVGTHADTALLAERLPARVIGIPASIENDIPLVEKSIGHDTACRVIAGIVGCLGTLAASSKRQWCFVRIAGRSLSHIIGEVARLTHPNLVILNEEIVGWSLADIVSLISDLISERAKNGFDFGIVVFPECVLDDLEEVRRLVDDLKTWGAHNNSNISGLSKVLLEVLPDKTRVEGTRLVEPELLLQALVGKELQRRRMFGGSGGSAFRSSVHVISHQARSALPSDFDCDLGLQMGLVAGKLARDKDRTGLLVTVSAEGCFGAVPLTSLLTCIFDKTTLECSLEIEQRKIDLNSVFHALPCPSMRRFMNPGPLQMGRKRQPAIRSVDVSGQLKKIEKVTALCSLLMSVDSGRREVIKSGLEHTLALLRAGREDSWSSNGKKPVERRRAGDWLRPLTRSHSRVVKIVPIT